MGLAEEEEIRHVEVVVGEEVAEEVAVLPHCIGTEAVDEEEGGFCGFVGFRNPAVDDGSTTKVGGGRVEAGVGKEIAV